MIATQDHLPASIPPQPELSQRESHLLAVFILLKFDLFKLAQQESLSPQDLLAFAGSAAVQTQLATLRSLAEDAFALRAVQLRSSALEILQDVAATTQDPIEKRRAASQLLRGLQLGQARQGLQPEPGRHVGQGRQVGRASGPPSDHQPPISPQPPATPSHTPSPTYSPLDTANIILDAFRNLKRPANAATLYAFAAPNARIFNCPIPADPAHFIAATIANANPYSSTYQSLRPGPAAPTTASFILTLCFNNHAARYRLDLSRSDNHPWLLSCLAEHSDSS